MAAVEYLQGRSTTGLKRAIPLAAAADRTEPRAGHGEIGRGRAPENRVAVRHSKSSSKLSSESWDRILPRLARDRPDILERVKSGEFKSARAAAIEAGIIRPVPTIRLTEPQKVAAKIQQHWTHEQITALMASLSQETETTNHLSLSRS